MEVYSARSPPFSFCCFRFLPFSFIISNVFGCCFIIFHILFLFFLFESSVSFIFRIDSLATRETIITVSFCLFSGFYCFLSHIYLDCAAKLVLVSQEPQGTIMSDQNNTPRPPDVELKFQMTKMMERMDFMMGNVCDRLDKVDKNYNMTGTYT